MATIETIKLESRLEHYRWYDEPVGLYLHIPFCESKCIYCDFNSYAKMEDKYGPFVDGLCKDLLSGVAGHLDGEPDCYGARVATVFFGGGTPSVLEPDQIGLILGAARSRYRIDPDAEITMEANPGTISLERFQGYRKAGINRLSMGVQVLDDVMLKKLGRIHTAEGAIQSYRWAREAGFDNINLDFIYGLPEQTLDHLSVTLDRLLQLDPLPDHLSCYSLIVEEHTPLYVGVSRGLITVPGEDVVAAMYELLADRLTSTGYTQYEISNWSRGKPCRHNLVYWHDERYLAFGPGASGYWGDTRYTTVLGPAAYIRRVATNTSVIAEKSQVSLQDELGEFMLLGLRLNDGVVKPEFERRFGRALDEVFGPVVELLESQGLVRNDPDSVSLTARGRLLGNEVFQRFID